MNPLKMLSRGGAVSAPSDADFENVTLLLHGDGTNGAQNNTFLDSSTNNFTITRNGNTTQGTFTPFSKVDGRWGNWFNNPEADSYAANNSLSVSYNSALVFGTGDFTVECWFYLTGNAPQSDPTNGASNRHAMLVNCGTADLGDGQGSRPGWSFLVRGDSSTTGTAIQFVHRINSTTTTSVIGTVTVNQNQWNHAAAVRSGTTTTVYLNGVAINSGTLSNQDISASIPLRIGELAGYSAGLVYPFPGYISNLRIVKGSAVYTSNFTPSTTPLTAITNTTLLTCQSNGFKDNSSNNFSVTPTGTPKVTPFSPFPTLTAYDAATNGGSGYFDGTDDRLSIAENSATRPGSSNFCFECFFYPTALPTIGTAATDYATLFSQGTSGVYAPLNVYYAGDKKIMVNISSTGSSWDIANTVKSNGTCELNQWTHVAMTRNGNNFDLYLNGVFDKTIATSSATLMTPTEPTYIGLRTGTGTPYPFTGYISSWRWVVGSAVYTSAFTPPTAPVTAITNTKLLLNYTNAGIIDNSMSNNLETVADAQIDTTTKKYGTGSMEFDGTGDYLSAPMTPEVVFGSGDMTIECWVNPNTISGIDTMFDTRTSGSYGNESFTFQINDGVPQVFAGSFSPSTPVAAGSSAISTSTWTHIAFTRNSGTNRLFVNGTSVASNSNSWTQTLVTSNLYTIGESIGRDRYFDGYIDDLRITKGKARYTTTFTPPTAALPDIGE